MSTSFIRLLLAIVVLPFVLVLDARAGHTSVNPGYCNATTNPLKSAHPLATYEVSDASRIVVMEYMVYFSPGGYGANPAGSIPNLAHYDPVAGFPNYDNGHCSIMGQHAAWFLQMGVDAVLVDLSNMTLCVFMTPAEDAATTICGGQYWKLQAVKNNIAALYAYYHAHNIPIRIIPMMGAQGPELYERSFFSPTDQRTAYHRGLAWFKSLTDAYPAQSVRYKGKPLMLSYMGTAAWITHVNNAIADAYPEGSTFTHRLMAGYTDSLPYLWDPNPGVTKIAGLNPIALTGTVVTHQYGTQYEMRYPVWSWLDRLNEPYNLRPTYATDTAAGKPENLAITTAFSGGTGWTAADARLRGDPGNAVLTDFTNKAKVLQPKFLFLSSFNEFGAPDQGTTNATSNDIEPASLWGMQWVDAIGAKMVEYKGALARPVNLSSRGLVGYGNDVVIAGFTLAGPGPKKVLLRGFGPFLGDVGIPGALANPRLDLHGVTGHLATNDDHGSGPTVHQPGVVTAHATAPGVMPHATESALLVTLNPGTYSVVLSMASGYPGIGMVAIDEQDQPGHPLTILSTRANVGTGNNVLVSGLIIAGDQSQKVVVRASGSILAPWFPGAYLNDPVVVVYSGATPIYSSNNRYDGGVDTWAGIPGMYHPPSSNDALLSATLAPGAYTIVVYDAGGGTGVALVEVHAQ